MSLLIGHVYTYFCDSILDPHNKSGIVVSSRASWIFWFNSNRRFHGIAQVPIAKGEHAVCTKDCYLDLSDVKRVSIEEARIATDNGPISVALRTKLVTELREPNRMLTQLKRETILRNLEAA